MKYNIDKFFDKKEKKLKYRSRFQLNKKEFRPVADTRQKLIEMIDEIRAQEHRAKFNLPVVQISPKLKDLFEKRKGAILMRHEKILAERVFDLLLSLLPADIEILNLKQAHFQLYIDARLPEVKPQTVNREISTISAALHLAPLYFSELENWVCFKIPKAKYKKQRRKRLITLDERIRLIKYLTRPQDPGEQLRDLYHRIRLAHIFEFGLLTGLRRKEIATLTFNQFSLSESCLYRVRRHKTGTVTEYFPVGRRVCEIIEERRKIQLCDYIFTPDGKPIESNYRTLREVCKELKIPYGRDLVDGFVLHDARHDFSTRMIQKTDLETTRAFTGHSGDEILTYLHTDENRMRKAMRDFEGVDVDKELLSVFGEVQAGQLTAEKFIEKVKKIAIF